VNPPIDPEVATIDPVLVTLKGAVDAVVEPAQNGYPPEDATPTEEAPVPAVRVLAERVNPPIEPDEAEMVPVKDPLVATNAPVSVTRKGAAEAVVLPAQNGYPPRDAIPTAEEPVPNVRELPPMAHPPIEPDVAVMLPVNDPLVATMLPVMEALLATNAPVSVTRNGATLEVVLPAQNGYPAVPTPTAEDPVPAVRADAPME
jgi:PHD/YefM family antitoxin component YafN of YafNO toxin-antitoxin module